MQAVEECAEQVRPGLVPDDDHAGGRHDLPGHHDFLAGDGLGDGLQERAGDPEPAGHEDARQPAAGDPAGQQQHRAAQTDGAAHREEPPVLAGKHLQSQQQGLQGEGQSEPGLLRAGRRQHLRDPRRAAAARQQAQAGNQPGPGAHRLHAQQRLHLQRHSPGRHLARDRQADQGQGRRQDRHHTRSQQAADRPHRPRPQKPDLRQKRKCRKHRHQNQGPGPS